jgi:hypothetical protein
MSLLFWDKEIDLVEEVIGCFVISLCKPNIYFVRLFHVVVNVTTSSQTLKYPNCTIRLPPLCMHNSTPIRTKVSLFLVQVFHVTFIIRRKSWQKLSPTLQCSRRKRDESTVYCPLKIPDSLEASENGTCHEMSLVGRGIENSVYCSKCG